MIRNNLLSKELLTSPVTRYVGFFAVIFWIAYLDSMFGGLLFDPASVYPFLIMMIVPVGFGLKNGRNVIRIARRSCIPVGIIVCVVNIVLTLTNMESRTELLLVTRLTYVPLALGIVLAFLLQIIEPTEEIDRDNKDSDFILAFFCNLFALSLAVYFLCELSDQIISVVDFVSTQALSAAMLISCICIIHPKMLHLNFVGKIYKSSLGIMLFFAIYGVSSYAYGSAITDPDIIVFAVALSTLGILYGALLSLIAIVAGGYLRESDQESMLFDWHMIESYAFYVLVILPPLSFLEYGDTVMN